MRGHDRQCQAVVSAANLFLRVICERETLLNDRESSNPDERTCFPGYLFRRQGPAPSTFQGQSLSCHAPRSIGVASKSEQGVRAGIAGEVKGTIRSSCDSDGAGPATPVRSLKACYQVFDAASMAIIKTHTYQLRLTPGGRRIARGPPVGSCRPGAMQGYDRVAFQVRLEGPARHENDSHGRAACREGRGRTLHLRRWPRRRRTDAFVPAHRLAVELKPRHPMEGAWHELAEIFGRQLESPVVWTVVAGVKHTRLWLPVEANGIAQARGEWPQYRLGTTLIQDQDAAATILKRIVFPQVLVAAVAADPQADIDPAYLISGSDASYWTSTEAQALNKKAGS
jgi:hypothetical protein